MSIETLSIGDPFFTVRIVKDEPRFAIHGKTIALNLSDEPMSVRAQQLGSLQSAILKDTTLTSVNHAVVVEGFANHVDDAALMARIRDTWPSAFEVRGEDRLRGIEHYMSPKVWVGQFGFTLYLEEPMAPGTTHRPMYDSEGNYPWHQFETITPSVFMAVEMLPDGATPPA